MWLRLRGGGARTQKSVGIKRRWIQRWDGTKRLSISGDDGANQGDNCTEEQARLLICLRHESDPTEKMCMMNGNRMSFPTLLCSGLTGFPQSSRVGGGAPHDLDQERRHGPGREREGGKRKREPTPSTRRRQVGGAPGG